MDIFESKFDEPWQNCTQVAMDIHDLWFGKFKSAIGGILKIIMPLERILRKNGAARLKDVLSDAREKSTMPQ